MSLQHRVFSIALVAGTLLFVLRAPLSAQWFPDGPRAAATHQLASQLREQQLAPPDQSEEQFATKVRSLVDAMAANIEELGVEGLEREAPTFTDIQLPKVDQPLLQLMNTYGMCTLPLHLELAADDDQRLYVLVGEIAVAIVVAYLRHQYIESGGTDEEIKAAMTSQAVLDLSYKVQVEQELRDHVSMLCAQPLALVTG